MTITFYRIFVGHEESEFSNSHLLSETALMSELLRSNDPVLISFVLASLADEDIEAVVLDQHTSVLEGSIGAIQRRVMVLSEDLPRAKRVLADLDIDENQS
jgi:hypothetical protein